MRAGCLLALAKLVPSYVVVPVVDWMRQMCKKRG
jgi:hypothetical protein